MLLGAARLAPIPTTWPFGTGGIEKVDWSILAGREVWLWPDRDKPGRRAMAWLAKHPRDLGCSVSAISPPEGPDDGWDAADAVSESVDMQAILGTATAGEADELMRADAQTGQPEPASTDASRPLHDPFRTLANVEAEPWDWLWPGWLPRSELTLRRGLRHGRPARGRRAPNLPARRGHGRRDHGGCKIKTDPKGGQKCAHALGQLQVDTFDEYAAKLQEDGMSGKPPGPRPSRSTRRRLRTSRTGTTTAAG